MAVKKVPDEILSIRALLSENPEGLTIGNISEILGINRNSAAKNLKLLQMQGRVTLKRVGNAKIYCLADKLPVDAVMKLSNNGVLIFSKGETVVGINEPLRQLLQIAKQDLIGKSTGNLPFSVESRPQLSRLIRDGLKGKETIISAELVIHDRSLPCTFTICPVFFENGDPGVALITDVPAGTKYPHRTGIGMEDSLAELDMSEYICRFAPDGTLNYVNQAYSDLLQKEKTDLIGHRWRPTIPESEYKKIRQCLLSLDRDHPVASLDFRSITPEGNSRWQRWIFRNLFDRNGMSIGYQGTGTDITGMKNLELKVSRGAEEIESLVREHNAVVKDLNRQIYTEIARHEKTHFQLQFTQFAMDNASYLITWVSRSGRLVYINKEAQQVLGYPYREMLKMRFLDVFALGTSSSWDDIWEAILRDQQYAIEAILMRHDGCEVPVEMVLNYLEFKGKQYCCCFAKDITDRKRAEDALRESEQKFRDIFNNTTEAIHICEIKDDTSPGRFIEVNEVCLRMLGYSKDEMLIKTPFEITTGYCSPPLEKILEEQRSFGTSRFETELMRKDGSIVPVELNSHVFTIQGKKVLLGVAQDITDRKRADEVLRESEGKLNAMLHSIGDSMSLMDNDLNIIWANETAKRYFGKDLIGRKCFEVYHQRNDPCEPYPCITLQAFQDGEIHRHETTVIDMYGQTHCFQCSANAAMIDESGKPFAVLEISHDITDRKRVEEALRESEARYKSISDATTDFVFSCIRSDGSTWSIDWMGGAVEQITGYTVYELRAMGCWRCLVYPDDRSVFDENIRDLSTGTSRACQLRILTKSGNVRWIAVDTTHVPPGGQSSSSHIFGGCRDITDRKRAEELLHDREQDFSTLVENATDMIVRFDPGLHYIYCNPAVEHQMGIKSHQLIGKTPLEFGRSVEENSFIEASLRRTLESGAEQEVEQTVLTPNGLRHFMTHIVPEHDFDGSIVSLLAITRDITWRKQAEEDFRAQSRQELEASYENLKKTETDLRLHQAELEIQNVEMRQVQHNLEISRSRYFELYDLAPAGYFTLSKKGLVLTANLTAATMLGVERNHLVKTPVSRYIVPDDQDIFYRCRNEVTKTRERELCEIRMLRPDRSPLRVQVIVVPAQVSEGEKADISLMIIDITERKQTDSGDATEREELSRNVREQ
jgi:PAS domain S-box-containing protein